MVTIKDVAKRANVSFTTVSHVINKTRPVSAETAERVTAAIADLGYFPSDVARALQSNRTRTIGMIVTTTSNPFFGEVIRGVERRCFERGYALMLCNTDDITENLVAYMRTLATKRVDAVVVMTTNASPEFYRRLDEIRPVPVVAIDAPISAVESVFSDDSLLGGRIVADYLADRGFARLACVSGPQDHPRMQDRIAGFTQRLRERGLPQPLIERTDISADGGLAAARRLLTARTSPDAVFALSDILAIGFLHGIHERGLAVPSDISIVGYDDIEFSAHTFPPLTTVRQPAAAIGAAAADAVIDNVERKVPLPRLVTLPPTLVSRKSVLQVRNPLSDD